MDSSSDDSGISQQPVHIPAVKKDTGPKNQAASSPGGADAIDNKQRGLLVDTNRSPSSVDMNLPIHDSGAETAAAVPARRSNLNDADAPEHFPNPHHNIAINGPGPSPALERDHASLNNGNNLMKGSSRLAVDNEGEFRGVTMRPSGKWVSLPKLGALFEVVSNCLNLFFRALDCSKFKFTTPGSLVTSVSINPNKMRPSSTNMRSASRRSSPRIMTPPVPKSRRLFR